MIKKEDIKTLNKAFEELNHMEIISIESNAFGVQVLVDDTGKFLEWAFDNDYDIVETDRLRVELKGIRVTNFYKEGPLYGNMH